MKKPFMWLFAYCFIFCIPVFGQAVDRTEYTAIDPFDYKLDEQSAAKGAVRKFKSVVQFASQNGTVFSFVSLDQKTTLNVSVPRHFSPPASAQKVTIYYTATKRIIDSLVLDEIDYSNTTEEGIGLVKSKVPDSLKINRSSYKEIDFFDYKIEAENAQRGDMRKYKSKARFSSQNGITYYFVSHVEGTMLSMKAWHRFPPLKKNQAITIYYTATKGIVDTLSLDDIEF